MLSIPVNYKIYNNSWFVDIGSNIGLYSLNITNINSKYTIVKSLLLATDKKPEVKIDWRIYTKDPNKPLIRDMIIEGLSLARTQKEEFASIIENNNGDISKLFDTLKEFVIK